MRGSVRAALLSFTAQFEGSLPFMYLDFHHKSDGTLDPLVTTGRGNLIDPLGAALRLPWRIKSTGAPATQVQVAAEWHAVKAMIELAHMGGGAFVHVTTLQLAQGDIDTLDYARTDSNERTLKARSPFASFDLWPADAQLGLLSMAWAMGPEFLFPHFQSAAASQDWMTAAGKPGNATDDFLIPNPYRGQAWMKDAFNGGLRKRNLANKVLFQNAARVLEENLDLNQLYYPDEIGLEITKS